MRAADHRGETERAGAMISRRTTLKIAIGAVCVGGLASYRSDRQVWTGRGFGADLSVTLKGPDDGVIQTFTAIEAEIARIDALFSLFQPDSALSRLNRAGRLTDPPADLVALLEMSRTVWTASGRVFDPTVQAIWHGPVTGNTPVGFQHVQVSPDEIRFGRPGMALTLNGIAQGFASDRIAALLHQRGYHAHLVDLGEFAGSGAPWRLAIQNLDDDQIAQTRLRDMALATSAPDAMLLRDGRCHILNPKGGDPIWRTVSVQARSAAMADGLSTALSLMPLKEIRALDREALGVSRIWLEDQHGGITEIG